jgi:hypothetical protein
VISMRGTLEGVSGCRNEPKGLRADCSALNSAFVIRSNANAGHAATMAASVITARLRRP